MVVTQLESTDTHKRVESLIQVVSNTLPRILLEDNADQLTCARIAHGHPQQKVMMDNQDVGLLTSNIIMLAVIMLSQEPPK